MWASRLERLVIVMQRLNFKCNSCDASFQVKTDYAQPIKALPAYCVYCGEANCLILQLDEDSNYWAILEEAYGLSAEVIKVFHEMWVNDPKSPQRFRDYLVQVHHLDFEQLKAANG